MLAKRIISAFVLISIIVGVIFVDWLCSLAIILFIIGGLYEYFVMLEKKGISIYKYFGIGMGTIIPLSIWLRFEPTKSWELLFAVVADVDTPVGEGRMSPHDAARVLPLGGLDQLGAADFLEPLRGQRGNQQFAALVEHPHPLSVADYMDRAPTGLGDRRQVLPDPIAGPRIQAAQFAIAVHTINVIALEVRRADHRVQGVSFSLAGSASPP